MWVGNHGYAMVRLALQFLGVSVHVELYCHGEYMFYTGRESLLFLG
jgi:hypothetical protein